MLDKIKNTIEKYKLIEKQDKVLIALSGGADSVCLCLALKELGFAVGAAHINHKIREEAYKDVLFVKGFCEKNNIKLHLLEENVRKIAAEEKVSEEVAGRNVRYAFLEKTASEFGYNKIAVAHNQDDNAETVILNLTRGSGSKGLCAIPEKRGNIVRPLLKTSRAEIEKYLKDKKQEFVTDKTNFECNYNRNKVRNLVIPKLLEINPSFIENVSKTSDIIREENNFLDECALKIVNIDKDKKISYIKKEDFFAAHKAIKARALCLAYESVAGTGKDFEKKHIDYIIENVKDSTHGNIIELAFETVCFAEYEKLCFSIRKKEEKFNVSIKPGEQAEIVQAGLLVTAKYVDVKDVVFSENTEYFDLNTETITLRSFENGDKIIPMGKTTSKKVKEIFINKKIPVRERMSKVVVETDEILCILGICRSNNFKINENTKKVLMIKGDKL